MLILYRSGGCITSAGIWAAWTAQWLMTNNFMLYRLSPASYNPVTDGPCACAAVLPLGLWHFWKQQQWLLCLWVFLTLRFLRISWYYYSGPGGEAWIIIWFMLNIFVWYTLLKCFSSSTQRKQKNAVFCCFRAVMCFSSCLVNALIHSVFCCYVLMKRRLT